MYWEKNLSLLSCNLTLEAVLSKNFVSQNHIYAFQVVLYVFVFHFCTYHAWGAKVVKPFYSMDGALLRAVRIILLIFLSFLFLLLFGLPSVRRYQEKQVNINYSNQIWIPLILGPRGNFQIWNRWYISSLHHPGGTWQCNKERMVGSLSLENILWHDKKGGFPCPETRTPFNSWKPSVVKRRISRDA